MSFDSFGFCPALMQSLNDQGHSIPTPVQERTIPKAALGKDLIVSAQTGSGKTGAFVLPALQKFQNEARQGHGPRMLILTPTRELARQVTKAAQTYSRHLHSIRCVTVLGGMPYGQQQRMLSRPFDILVATPGRLLDLLDRDGISLANVQILVLDEADRMLDMGFIDDVDAIVQRTPKERQTLLFSATVEGDLANLTRRILKEPEMIQINQVQEQHGNISQKLYFSDDLTHKKALLLQILNLEEVDQAIVFTATKLDADQLASELDTSGISCAALHGDMRQKMRNRTLDQVHGRKVKVLVATDIAARGLDVAGVSHVVNFDLPKVVEDYVHRIGRTGRGGRNGTAISLVSMRDRMLLARISQYTGQKIEPHTFAGLEPKNRISEPRGVRRQGQGQGQGQGQPPSRNSYRQRDNTAHHHSNSYTSSYSKSSANTYPSSGSGNDSRGTDKRELYYGAAQNTTNPRSADTQRTPRPERSSSFPSGKPAWKPHSTHTEASGNRAEGRREDRHSAEPGRHSNRDNPRKPWEKRPNPHTPQFFSRMDSGRNYSHETKEEPVSAAVQKAKTPSKITYVSRSRLVKPES